MSDERPSRGSKVEKHVRVEQTPRGRRGARSKIRFAVESARRQIGALSELAIGDAVTGYLRQRVRIEVLEARRLLSGAHDPALVAAIEAGLSPGSNSGVESWANRLTDSTLLGRSVPVVGTGLSSFNPQTPLSNVLNNFNESATTFAGLQTSLNSTSGVIVSGARNNPNDLEYDLVVTDTTSGQVALSAQFSSGFATSGTVNFNETLTFAFTIGAYYNSTTSQAVPYLLTSNDNLTLSFNASAATLAQTAQLGFISLNVSQAAVNFSPVYSFTLKSQDAITGTDRLSLSTLNTDTLGNIVSCAVTQSAPATLTAQISTPLEPSATSITFTWANIAEPSSVTSTLATDPALAGLNSFYNISPGAISLGLDQVVALLDAGASQSVTATNPLLTELPLINESVSSLVNLPTFFQTYLTNYTDSTTNSSTGATTTTFNDDAQLLSVLQGIPNVGASNVTETASGSELIFNLTIPETVTTSAPLALSLQSQLDLSLSGTVNVSVATTTQFSFGVDGSTGTFFVVDPTRSVFSAAVNFSSTITQATTLGFLGVNIADGTLSATAQAGLALMDPDTNVPPTPGRITSNELQVSSGTFASVVGMSLSGSASASLPLTVSGTNLTGIMPATLNISWPDVNNSTNFTVATTGVSQFLDFNSLTNASTGSYLAQLPTVATDLTSTAGFGQSLPLIGMSLGSAADFSTPLTNAINSAASAGTIQDFITSLQNDLPSGSTVQAALNSTNNELDLNFDLANTYSGNSQSVSWSVSEPVVNPSDNSTLDFSDSGSAALTGTVALQLATGVQLSPQLLSSVQPVTDPQSQVSIFTGGGTGSSAGSSLNADFDVQATVNGPASLGFASIGVSNGALIFGNTNGSSTITSSVPATANLVVGTGAPGTAQTVESILADLPALYGAFNTSGAASLTLPLTGIATSTQSPSVHPQISVTWPSLTSTPIVTSVGLDSSNLTPIENFNSGGFGTGFQSLINVFQQWGEQAGVNQKLPFILKPIGSIVNYTSDATSALNAVESAIESSSTPTAINSAILGVTGITAGTANAPGSSSFDYVLTVSNTSSSTFPFTIGSSLLKLSTQVQASATFTMKLEFGYDQADGFYVVGGPSLASVSGSLSTTASDASLTVSNFHGVANGTASANFNFAFGLNAPVASKVPAVQLAMPAALQTTLSGSGSLNLVFGAKLGSSGPGIIDSYTESWDPSRLVPREYGPNNSSSRNDGFGTPQFDAGELFNDIIRPVFVEIAKFNPIPQSVLNVLNTKLPWPLSGMTIGDMLGDYAHSPKLGLLLQIAGENSAISSFIAAHPYTPADVSNPASNPGADPTQSTYISFVKGLESEFGVSVPLFDNPSTVLNDLLIGTNVSLFKFDPGNVQLSGGYSTPRIEIPVFGIGVVNIDVFVQISLSVSLFANINLGLNGRGLEGHYIADNKYSTTQTPNLLDGFYIGDGSAYQAGIRFQGVVKFGGDVSIFGFPFVSLYGGVGPYAEGGVHVNDVYYDPTTKQPVGVANYNGSGAGDGKVYLDELQWITQNYGPECAIMPTGEIGLHIELGGQVNLLFWSINFTIYQHDFELASWNTPCVPNLTTFGSIQGDAFVFDPNPATQGRDIDVEMGQDISNGGAPALEISESNSSFYGTQYVDLSTLQAAGVNTIDIQGTNGDDTFSVDPEITTKGPFRNININTGQGNDQADLTNLTKQNSNVSNVAITGGTGGASDNDTINGCYAPDTIYAGDGKNLIVPGGGNDVVYETSGDDTINAGDGNNTVVGGTGKSVLITTGKGNNSVTAGSGADTILAGDGNNTIVAGSGVDSIDAGYGDDLVESGTGTDTVTAGNGRDTLYGDSGGAEIDAGTGNNVIYTEGGNTVVNGHPAGAPAGEDYINIGPGNASVVGGDGDNWLAENYHGNQTLTDGKLVTAQGTTLFNGIDGISLTGGSGDSFDVSAYTGGNVTLNGSAGNDTVICTANDDFTLTNNTLTRADGATFALVGISDAVLTTGSLDTDFNVTGFSGHATLNGGGGNDTVEAATPASYTLTNASMTSSYGVQLTLSGINRAVLSGGSGSDDINLSGFSGNVTLLAAAAEDTLVKGTGDTQIEGTTLPNTPATLPNSPGSGGPWEELRGSASGLGLSASSDSAIEPAAAASAQDYYVAWADNRSGTYQIYLAVNASAWKELAGSAHGGGLSDGIGDARRPSIALDASGNPIVAWTQYSAGDASSSIQVADYVPSANGSSGSWVMLPSPSGSSADDAHIVETASGPVVAWLDSTAGATNVYVAQYTGTAWTALGAGSTSGSGVSGSSTSVGGLTVATDGTNVAVGWTQSVGSTTQIYLKQFSGSAWSALGGSASGNGISGSTGNGDSASLAYDNGSLFVAWRATNGGLSQVYAAQFSGTNWSSAGSSAGSSLVSGTSGGSAQPVLSSGDNQLFLAWTTNRVTNGSGVGSALYVMRWDAKLSKFVEPLPGTATGPGISPTTSAPQSPSLSVSPTGAALIAWGDTMDGAPQVDARLSVSTGTIYYVNDSSTAGDTLCTAPGSASNNGLSPKTPALSVSQILSKYSLKYGSVIVVDTGTYSDSITIPVAGISVIAAPDAVPNFEGPITISSADKVVLKGLNLSGGLSVSNSSKVTVVDDNFYGSGIMLSGGSADQILHDLVQADGESSAGGIQLTGQTTLPAVQSDTVVGAANGIDVVSASNILIRDNQINNCLTGIDLSTATTGTVSGNNVSDTQTALNIAAAFTGSIDSNNFQLSTIGVVYSASAPLNANLIHDDGEGIVSTVAGSTAGLGFVEGSGIDKLPKPYTAPNQIYLNSLGVSLTGQMEDQHVYGNTTGVIGSGILGGTDITVPNIIEANVLGADFSGLIQFNRIDRNYTGILANSDNTITHNVVYRNTNVGIEVSGDDNVRVVNNTLYTATGDLLRLENGSTETEVINNIFWDSSGTDLYISNDGAAGLFSDYNDLYVTGSGIIAHLVNDYYDILDWQDDVDLYDLHSIGTTVVNPTWAQPAFADLLDDNYTVNALAGGLRPSSPTIDAGDPLTDIGLPASASTSNLLSNPSFESGTTGWTVNSTGTTAAGNPNSFDGDSHFVVGQAASGFALQTINLLTAGFTASTLDSQSDLAVFGGRIRWNSNQAGDMALVTLSFLDSSGNVLGTATATAEDLTDQWELVGQTFRLPVHTRSIKYEFETTRLSGNDDCSFDSAFLYVQKDTVAVDQGAYGNTTPELAKQSTAAHIALRYPDLYVNWDLNTPQTILWTTYGNHSRLPVDISLYQVQSNGTKVNLGTIAAAAADNGQYTWTPSTFRGTGGTQLSEGTYGLHIMVSLVGDSSATDHSTEPFAIPEAGNSFYVNDNSTTGDQYSTAVGSNRNDGKSPSAPLPLLTTLLRTYNLGPNETVYVDTGTYTDYSNILITSAHDQGVTITGPTNASDVADITDPVFGLASAAIELNDAGYTTIEYLTLAPAQRAVWAYNGTTHFLGSYLTTSANTDEAVRVESNCSYVTLDHLSDAGSGSGSYGIYAVYLAGNNDTLSNSSLNDNGLPAEIYSSGNGSLIAGNAVTGHDEEGMSISGAGVTVSGNTIYGDSQDGLDVSGSYGLQTTVSGNTVYDEPGTGISATGSSLLLSGNTVYGSGTGLYLSSASAAASGNILYDNTTGVSAYYGTVSGNRVYDNSGAGIVAYDNSAISGNDVYSNATGILAEPYYSYYSGSIANNLVYANSGLGIDLRESSGAQILNNTVYQIAGDALRVESSSGYNSGAGSTNTAVYNNILWSQSGYDINVDNQSQVGFNSDYNDLRVSSTGRVADWQGVAYAGLSDWFGNVGFDFHSISADPQFVNPAGADGILGYNSTTGTDGGKDDNFKLKAGSPAVDAGSLGSYYLSEAYPNGDRIDLGAYGNTASATASSNPQIQVLSPNGGDELSVGTAATISWLTSGLTQQDTVALINTGGGIADGESNGAGQGLWMADAYLTTTGYNQTITQPINTSGVTDPAPQAVYQDYTQANGGTGNGLVYSLPVPNGSYNIELLFASPDSAAGQRVFNVMLNGTTVKSNYDIYAAAGAADKATELNFSVNASGGTGITLDLANTTTGYYPAMLNGLKLTRVNSKGAASPQVNLQVSLDGGSTWSTIASGLAVDAYGRGSYSWTPSNASISSDALVRVVSTGVTPAVLGLKQANCPHRDLG